MPVKSQAQRGYLNAKFGHAWVKRHHFDNKGKLPAHVGGGKAKKGKAMKGKSPGFGNAAGTLGGKSAAGAYKGKHGKKHKSGKGYGTRRHSGSECYMEGPRSSNEKHR